jgi:hypothetical protein
MTLMLFLGAWGKMIREKTFSKKSRDTVPLSWGVNRMVAEELRIKGHRDRTKKFL